MSSVPRDAVVGDGAGRESSPASPLPNAIGEIADDVSAEGSVTLQSEPVVENATAPQQDEALVPAATSLSPQPTVDTDSLHGPLTGENPITALIPSAEGDSTTLQDATPAPTATLPYVVAQHATTVTTVTTVEASTFCQELSDIGQPSPLKRPRSPTPPPATAETIPANLPELQCEYVIESIIKGVTKELNNVLRDCGMLLGSKETYNMRFEPDDEQIRGEAARRFGAPLKDIATTVEYGMTQTWARFASGIITRYGTDMRRDLFDDVERRARSVTEGVLARAANPSPTPPHFPEPEPETPQSRPSSRLRPRSRSPSPLRSHFPPSNTPQPRPGVSSSPAGPTTPKGSNKRQLSSSLGHASAPPIRIQRSSNRRHRPHHPTRPPPATPTKPPSSGKNKARTTNPERPVTTPRRPALNRDLLSSRLEREQCLARTPTRTPPRSGLFAPPNTFTPRTNPPTGINPFALANPSAPVNPFATPHFNPFAAPNPNPFLSASEGANRGRVVGHLGRYPVMEPSPQRTRSNDADADEATGDDDVFTD